MGISFHYDFIHIMCSKGGATDSYGRKIQLYKDVRKIISELHDADIKVAAASRYVRVLAGYVPALT